MDASKLVYTANTNKPPTTFINRTLFCEFHKTLNCKINNYCRKRPVDYSTDLPYINIKQ